MAKKEKQEELTWEYCEKCKHCHPTSVALPFPISGMGGGGSNRRLKKWQSGGLVAMAATVVLGIVVGIVFMGVQMFRENPDAGIKGTLEQMIRDREKIKKIIEEEAIEGAGKAVLGAAEATTDNIENASIKIAMGGAKGAYDGANKNVDDDDKGTPDKKLASNDKKLKFKSNKNSVADHEISSFGNQGSNNYNGGQINSSSPQPVSDEFDPDEFTAMVEGVRNDLLNQGVFDSPPASNSEP